MSTAQTYSDAHTNGNEHKEIVIINSRTERQPPTNKSLDLCH